MNAKTLLILLLVLACAASPAAVLAAAPATADWIDAYGDPWGSYVHPR